ncbi:uncharacterized protein F4812DRAFT_208352 [Daldinia caldariorum]|uniref:uncharacterized protein n=1 Tax=Daldinia caldariorum TaxID=326644 RepID=UPI0020086A3D|nr:uncharacterized protein F4812DRAFT_208352 [Daldinia caldariorum]KAI1464352.1 hypothetical protein F4812DRAFT_208352 [Daldinia caldariorum]
MDALYFDTFGERPIDNSDPTDIHSGYSSCSEAEDTPCPKCLRTRGKLCRKCKLRLRARGDSKDNAKSSLEFVSSRNSNKSNDSTPGRHLESLGLSKLKMPRRVKSDDLSTVEHDSPAEVNIEETSNYMLWGANSRSSYRRYENEGWDHGQCHKWSQTDYRSWTYGKYQEWDQNGSTEWSYNKYEEWHRRDYTENLLGRRKRSHFVRGRALQPFRIRSMNPRIDRDEPRYMAEIWQYTSRKRAPNPRLMLYGMQSCGILTLPYGSRVYARQRTLNLKYTTDYLWFMLLKWSVRICRSLVAVVVGLFRYGRLPAPVPEELD